MGRGYVIVIASVAFTNIESLAPGPSIKKGEMIKVNIQKNNEKKRIPFIAYKNNFMDL